MFDKGERLGISLHERATSLQFLMQPIGASVGPSYQHGLPLPWISIGIHFSILDVFILL